MTNYLDPGGMFPVTDGIVPVVPNNVPPGFDLTSLLSETMRDRVQWIDFAKTASRILWKYVEATRISLEMSRDPVNIGRVLKIATLRMMGLNWNSDLITDDAYDRIISDIALYNQNHGPEDFVGYIGYALGIPLSLATLWTADYKAFAPGPQQSAIYSEPPGLYYPTSHVALLYEQYADYSSLGYLNSGAGDADGLNQTYLDALKQIFYQMAPIHLVLEWIGSVVTLNVGVLWLSSNMYERSEDTILTNNDPIAPLNYQELMFERSIDIAILTPLYPNRLISTNMAAFGIENGADGATATPLGYNFVSGWNTPIDASMIIVGGYATYTTQFDTLLNSPIPNVQWTDPSETYSGLLVQRSLNLLLSASGSPNYNNWIGSCAITNTYTRYDGGLGYNIATTFAGSNMSSCILPSTTDCVMFTFRPNATSTVAIARGSQTVSVDTTTFVITAGGGVTSSGVFSVGSGFYTLWAIMTGGIVSVYPGGLTGSGAVDWLDCQILQGSNYPAPIHSTLPSLGSFDTLEPIVTVFGAIGDDFTDDVTDDFGGASQISSYAGASMTKNNTAWFEGAEVDITNFSPSVAAQSTPTPLTGTMISMTPKQFNYSNGVAILKIDMLYDEWVLSGTQTIFQGYNPDGNGPLVTISNAGITITMIGSALAPIVVPFTNNRVYFGMKWSPTGVIFYLNGTPYNFADKMPINISLVSIGNAKATVATSTMVIESMFALGWADPAVLPTNAYMIAATTPTNNTRIIGVTAATTAAQFISTGNFKELISLPGVQATATTASFVL